MRLSDDERLIATAALVASRSLRRMIGIAGLVSMIVLAPLSMIVGGLMDDPHGPPASHNAAALGLLGFYLFFIGGTVAVIVRAVTAFLAWCARRVQRDINRDW
jgi:hypothetical protein